MGRGTVVVAVLVAIWMAGTEHARASAGSARTAIVSLGDSFISGEGGRWLGNGSDLWGTRSGTDRAAFACGEGPGCRYDPHRVYGATEDNGCHRSDVAPILSAPIAVGEAVDLACSGARTTNVRRAVDSGEWLRGEPPQADSLAALARRDDVELIVLTVGANDVGFGEVVARCALDWARSSPEDPRYCGPSGRASIGAKLPDMRAGLVVALRGVRATMAASGYSRDEYRLATMGYASPFPAGDRFRYPESGWDRLRLGGCPVWNADADWAVREATPRTDAAMRSAAAAVGAEYLDLQHALDGHQLCDRRARRIGAEGPDPATAEWVRRLGFAPGATRESLHPNAYGQRAIGACIGMLYARAAGDYSCRATPGHSYEDGMSLKPLE